MRKKSGFTLIELLVVVLIIGILAAVALPKYELAVAKSRYTQLMIGADMIKKANQLYYMANGKYSLDLNELDLSLSGCEISEDGKNCRLKNGGICYINDGSHNAQGLVPIALCSNKGMYYLVNFSNDRWCYATETNDVANQLCKSMGGVFQHTSNGHNNYILP